ncbi:hypothetical protein Tco_1284450 [Tanacetum coccineum]
MECSLPHTDSEVEALVQRLINEDKGRQDALLNLAFQFEDSCAVYQNEDLRPVAKGLIVSVLRKTCSSRSSEDLRVRGLVLSEMENLLNMLNIK